MGCRISCCWAFFQNYESLLLQNSWELIFFFFLLFLQSFSLKSVYVRNLLRRLQMENSYTFSCIILTKKPYIILYSLSRMFPMLTPHQKENSHCFLGNYSFSFLSSYLTQKNSLLLNFNSNLLLLVARIIPEVDDSR